MCLSCQKTEPLLVVHVMRDTSKPFASKLRQSDMQFGLTKPHLRNGKGVIAATFEATSFPQLLAKVDQLAPDLLILDKQGDLPDQGVMGRLGASRPVCGGHPAYVPDWVSGEEREAATMYLDFLTTHCESTPAH